MSIWGKIGGAAAGLMVGGPVGAAIGAVAGHFLIDRPGDPGVTFTIAVIALSAKMAKADGTVSDAEFAAFQRIFQIPADEAANVRRVFDLARRDVAGYEIYAGQIARLLAGNPALLEDILDGLFEIAKADGVLHPAEAVFLERVADIFGFAPNEYRRIRASHVPPDLADPYAILGVGYDAGDEEIRLMYRRLIKENHPDRLIARGVPEEFLRMANDKVSAINTAYEKIIRERGLSR